MRERLQRGLHDVQWRVRRGGPDCGGVCGAGRTHELVRVYDRAVRNDFRCAQRSVRGRENARVPGKRHVQGDGRALERRDAARRMDLCRRLVATRVFRRSLGRSDYQGRGRRPCRRERQRGRDCDRRLSDARDADDQSKDSAAPGESLYGLFAANADTVMLQNVEVLVAGGGDGQGGSQGTGGGAPPSSCTAAAGTGMNGAPGTPGSGGPGAAAGTWSPTGYAAASGGTGRRAAPAATGAQGISDLAFRPPRTRATATRASQPAIR